MKRILTLLTIFSFLTPGFSQDYVEDPVVVYSDDDDEIFNRGSIVGAETQEMIRARNRVRNRNWGIALGTTIIGAAVMILTGLDHNSK